MERHEAALNQIATTVRTLYSRRQPYRIFHGSTNSTRPIDKDRGVVDISALSNVIKIDAEAKVAVVEPNVSMDRLVRETLEYGLVPPVVMEFPGITVGGGYAGSAIESSSFKYGYFDENINSVEMVLANGEVVTASRTERPDLFKGAGGALGTLGITTLIELRLIPAKRFVKTVYHRTSNIHDAVHVTRKEIENSSNDFVDGIIFSKTHGVVILGQLTDDKPDSTKPQTFSKPWDPWFYLHVRKGTEEKSPSTPAVDYIPLVDYLFRYDRGGFWVGAAAFGYFPFVPFNRWTRWFLDDFMHTRMLYRALHASKKSFSYMVQDLSLPYSTAEEFIDYTTEQFGIWPLWLCPLRKIEAPTFHPSTTLQSSPSDDSYTPKPMLNIGLWGNASEDMETFVRQNQGLERKLTELGGRKLLYSHTYYTEQEFWQLYDRRWYEDLRQRYSATTLPSVYEKARVDVSKYSLQGLSWLQQLALRWPIAGLVGLFWAIRSKDYLLHRSPLWQPQQQAHNKEKIS